MRVLKAAPDRRLMLIISSNAYRDRQHDTITTAALERWASRQWQGDVYTGSCRYLFWHDDSLVMGDIIYSDVSCGFLVEVAQEGDGVLARALWDGIERGQFRGASSQGFYVMASHFEKNETDGTMMEVIDEIEKIETSWLPREAAANALTYAEVIVKKGDVLNALLGMDNAAALLDEGLDKLVSELEKHNMMAKALAGSSTTKVQRLARLKRTLDATLKELESEEVAEVEAIAAEAVENVVAEQAAEVAEAMMADDIMDALIERLTAIEDRLTALEGGAPPVTEASYTEDMEKQKARQPRIARRASEAAETIVDLDVAHPARKSWGQPRKTFFGREV